MGPEPEEIILGEVGGVGEAAAGAVSGVETGSGPVAGLRGLLGPLLEPAARRPVDYRGSEVALQVNPLVDARLGLGSGVASECEVGESLALCADALGGVGSGHLSPLGYLALAVGRVVVRVAARGAGQQAAGPVAVVELGKG